MVDVEDFPAWARRRFDRHFRRGGSGRIVRWMSVPAGALADPVADAAGPAPDSGLSTDNVIVLARMPAPITAAPAAKSARAMAAR